MTLSTEQRALFERDGYVVVPGMFDTAAVADLSRWTSELLGARRADLEALMSEWEQVSQTIEANR